MSKIIIHNVQLNQQPSDVVIEDKYFRSITPAAADFIPPADAKVIDGTNLAIAAPFYNTHNHAGMTLLRGFADDMRLQEWLNEHIWPIEAKLTAKITYDGVRLAILEMIKSGTVSFNDMYFFQTQTIRAAEEMGVRAQVGVLEMKFADSRYENDEIWERRKDYSDLIQINLAPHAIYTTTKELLQSVADKSEQFNVAIHTHAAETRFEVDSCLKEHNMTPIEYLDSVGILRRNTILAHCVHLTSHDMELIQKRQAVIAHNPCSNAKLASGICELDKLLKHGCRVTIGTDGCSSNNNLSMLEEMKFAALLAKVSTSDPTAANANMIYQLATRNGAEAFDINAGGIAVGKLADCILVNIKHHRLTGGDNLISHLVYSASEEVVNSVICNGRILMENRKVENEADIIDSARESCRILQQSQTK